MFPEVHRLLLTTDTDIHFGLIRTSFCFHSQQSVLFLKPLRPEAITENFKHVVYWMLFLTTSPLFIHLSPKQQGSLLNQLTAALRVCLCVCNLHGN